MSKGSNKRRVERGQLAKKKVQYRKRFMTKLQCTIAYGAYDSKDILGARQSSSARMLAEKMANLYFLLMLKELETRKANYKKTNDIMNN